jgi:protoporphyrinogen/coproporphyrinogen III oxidase
MIGIVGAGISGLALGLELQERGVPYRVFERRRTAGGVIRTVTARGLRLELGPQRIRATPEILRRFALEAEDGHPHLPILLARGGQLHPLPESLSDGLRSQALSLRGKARAALWPLMALRRPSPGTVSAGAYLRHLAGVEAYRTFLGPLFGGLYGSDPDSMDAHRSLLPALDSMGGRGLLTFLGIRNGRGTGLGRYPPMVPAGGMASLPWTLLARQADAVSLGAPVVGLRSGTEGAFELQAGGAWVPVEAVVITTPPEPAAHLLRALAPDVSWRLRRLRLNRLVLVHLQVDHLPPALGFQVSFGESRRIRGATFAGNLDGSGRSAVVYMGGALDPEAHLASDAELGKVATSEFASLTGIQGEPIHVHRATMPAWDSSWRALDGMELPRGVHLLTNYTGRPGIPGRLQEAAALAELLATTRGS